MANEPPYEIISSGAVNDAFRRLLLRAIDQGAEPAVIHAMRRIWSRLESDPLTFGEQVFDLTRMHLQMRVASIRPLGIFYGVDAAARRVFIARIALLSNA
jgi:hypothetical protein